MPDSRANPESHNPEGVVALLRIEEIELGACMDCPQFWLGSMVASSSSAHQRSTGHEVLLVTITSGHILQPTSGYALPEGMGEQAAS